MGTIMELYDQLMSVVDEKPDRRFKSWAKEVAAVDENQTNGYAFEGQFVPEGTAEIEVRPRLFLVMTTSGSRRYQTSFYQIVEMLSDGTLEPTHITTTSATPGWALRIRDAVRDKLEGIRAEPEVPTIDVSPDDDQHLLMAFRNLGYNQALLDCDVASQDDNPRSVRTRTEAYINDLNATILLAARCAHCGRAIDLRDASWGGIEAICDCGIEWMAASQAGEWDVNAERKRVE